MKKYYPQNNTAKHLIIIFVLTAISQTLLSQITFPRISINQTIAPDTSINMESKELFFDPALPDVKSIGKGSTTVTGWKGYNAMLMNPAYLSTSDFSFEIADAQVTIPSSTVQTLSYIKNNQEDMQDGRFLKQMAEGINNLRRINNDEAQQEGLEQIYDASSFGDEMLTNIIGSPTEPTRHGFIAFPNFKFQYKNFGVSLYNSTTASLFVTSGDILNLLRNIHNIKDQKVANEQYLLQATGFLYDSYNADGTIDSDALPIIYSLASSTTALTFGYGKDINNKLSLGANLHLYRRAFSLSIIESADYDEIFDMATQGFENPIYGINLTAGAEYKQSEKLTFGIVASNFLPSKTIQQEVDITAQNSKVDYTIIGDSWKDSVAINLFSQQTTKVYQYELKIPFTLNIGTNWNPINNLSISAEMADAFGNDKTRYNVYFDRFRTGIEYTLFNNFVSLRSGMAYLKPTVGGGVSIPIRKFRIDLDAAYAHTKTNNTYATYVQLKLSYKPWSTKATQ